MPPFQGGSANNPKVVGSVPPSIQTRSAAGNDSGNRNHSRIWHVKLCGRNPPGPRRPRFRRNPMGRRRCCGPAPGVTSRGPLRRASCVPGVVWYACSMSQNTNLLFVNGNTATVDEPYENVKRVISGIMASPEWIELTESDTGRKRMFHVPNITSYGPLH